MNRTEIFSQIERHLGEGTFGAVKVVQENGIRYAVKNISKDKVRVHHRQRQLIREIESMKKLNHENIVRYIDFQQNQSQYQIKMQICQGKSLQEFLLSDSYLQNKLRFNSIYYAIKLSLDLINALAQLKIHYISNRDMKPENNMVIQFTSGKILLKMIDFGQAFFNVTQAHTKVGTLTYMAPQVYFLSKYNQKCDQWSLGWQIYQIFTKPRQTEKRKYLACPFKRDFNHQKPQQFTRLYSQYIWEGKNIQLSIPSPFRKIILGFLQVDPEKRMDIASAIHILISYFNQFLAEYLPQQDRDNQLKKLQSSLFNLKQSKLKKDNIKKAIQKLKILYLQIHKPFKQRISFQIYKNNIQFIKLLRFVYKNIKQSLRQLYKSMEISLQLAFQDILLPIMSRQQYRQLQCLHDRIMNNLYIQRIDIRNQFDHVTTSLHKFIQENGGFSSQEIKKIIQHVDFYKNSEFQPLGAKY